MRKKHLMKKFLTAASITVLVMGSLSGCGDSEDAKKESAKTEETSKDEKANHAEENEDGSEEDHSDSSVLLTDDFWLGDIEGEQIKLAYLGKIEENNYVLFSGFELEDGTKWVVTNGHKMTGSTVQDDDEATIGDGVEKDSYSYEGYMYVGELQDDSQNQEVDEQGTTWIHVNYKSLDGQDVSVSIGEKTDGTFIMIDPDGNEIAEVFEITNEDAADIIAQNAVLY